MTNSSDHELERVLARVAGVEITESNPGKDGSVCWCFLKDIEHGRPKSRRKFIYSKWAPLHDANQMEPVKAKLREMGLGYQMNWNGLMGAHQVFLYRAGFRDDPSPKTKDKSELRAFALAVWAWWEERKKEKAT